MKMLETRKREGYTIRRYVDEESDVRLTTIELPIAALRAFSMRRAVGQIEVAHRGLQKRIAAAKKKAAIYALLAEGWKPTAIAHEAECTDSYVRMLRSQLTQERVRGPQKKVKRVKPNGTTAQIAEIRGEYANT